MTDELYSLNEMQEVVQVPDESKNSHGGGSSSSSIPCVAREGG